MDILATHPDFWLYILIGLTSVFGTAFLITLVFYLRTWHQRNIAYAVLLQKCSGTKKAAQELIAATNNFYDHTDDKYTRRWSLDNMISRLDKAAHRVIQGY